MSARSGSGRGRGTGCQSTSRGSTRWCGRQGRQGGGPAVLGEGGAADPAGVRFPQDRRREEHTAGQDGPDDGADPQRQWEAVRGDLQPRVSGRRDGRRRSAPPRPGAGRVPGDPRGAAGPAGDRRHLRPLGARGADPHRQRLEFGAVQAGGQRVPGPEDLFHQQHLRPVREDRRRRRGGGARHRDGQPDRPQVSERERRLRRLLLQEGHPEPGLYLGVLRARGGGPLLAVGARYQRVPGSPLRKADTGDTRESPAIHVARKLLEEKASLAVSDPKALANARVDLAGLEGVEFIEEPSEAARGAHAVAIMTEWEMVRGLDWVRIYASMEKPAFLFDGRNLLNHKRMYEIGFNVYPLGGPALRHF